MTRADLRTEVFRRLQESSSAPVFWTADDIDAAVDEGYDELSDATEWCERWFTVDLLQQRPAYDLRTLTTDTVLNIGRAFHVDTNRWLTPTTPRELDRGYRRWETVTGAPIRLWMSGLWWLRYYPLAGTDAGEVKQYIVVLPDALADDADEPGFPETLHYGLVEYALADLWAQDGEPTKALAAWKAYLAYEAGLMAFVQGRAAVPLERAHG